MLLLHLSLLVASCIASSLISSELELEVNTFDDGFRSYSHNHLTAYMRSNGIEEYFVKNLIINNNSYGPPYHHLNPHLDEFGIYQIIDKLDFGTNSKYLGLEPNKGEHLGAIREMFGDLVKKEIFQGNYRIWIKNVIVNGKNYKTYKINERFYVL